MSYELDVWTEGGGVNSFPQAFSKLALNENSHNTTSCCCVEGTPQMNTRRRTIHQDFTSPFKIKGKNSFFSETKLK